MAVSYTHLDVYKRQAKKCFDTKKAERFFKERRIKYHLIDMKEKGMSKGELSSVKSSVGINELINTKAKNYSKSNLGNIRSCLLYTSRCV